MEERKIYSRRFPKKEWEERDKIWMVLCRSFLQRYVRPSDTVLDVGAGYCEFINNIQCGKKYAVDLNEETRDFAHEEVTVLQTRASALSDIGDETIDVAFASNFFEHLESKDELLATLWEIGRVMKSGGRLLILQPNIKYSYKDFWDFFDHYLPLSHKSMIEALELTGFAVLEVRPKFLPFTTKSSLPKHPLLVELYLRSQLAQWIMGRQMFIVATKVTPSAHGDVQGGRSH